MQATVLDRMQPPIEQMEAGDKQRALSTADRWLRSARTATKVLPPPLSAMAVRIFDDLSNLSMAAFPVAIAEV
jgi:hypothetical protein